MMADALAAELLELEPRTCGLCGLTVDRHDMVDDGDGPQFFCADISPADLTLEELERRAELIAAEQAADLLRRWEMSDPRDRWRHTGEPPPALDVRNGRMEVSRPRAPEPYLPAQSTIDAWTYVSNSGNLAYIREWLADRPKDAPYLLALLAEGQRDAA